MDELRGATIREYLDTNNYYNPTEVVTTLRRIGLRLLRGGPKLGYRSRSKLDPSRPAGAEGPGKGTSS
ncbi:MAG: hypothetical protein IV100_05835 [Myxococcales bacterium]|nr:hypothetical protein [Myxococcales bacterium]